ncbi:hypothetical protein IV203_000333 [Nitzschia inconspicua]|uniref:Uncharacterized protein n=1 Tax=Nitzschia inconspicua TaxID=303405 RepID=A0A9K3PQ63_9STRA|nr:hypothetical protein IV203_000333 [Nitzschia inconspicua]
MPETPIEDTSANITSTTPALTTGSSAVVDSQDLAVRIHEDAESVSETKKIARLPPVLYVLFVLNGLTLALFMLPMMYIVNTRVKIPVAYLSTYGSVAFLPYSFKPIYAYLSSSPEIHIPLPTWACYRNGPSWVRFHLPPRNIVFILLLMMNSACLILYASIPPGGVIFAFVVAFFKGFSDAWSSLCLGLTMIDIGRYSAAPITENENTENSSSDTTENSGAMVYDKIVSYFQAQAATARNVGSVIGGAVTLLVFLQRYLAAKGKEEDNNIEQLSGGVANGLLYFTSSLNLVGACVAFTFRHALKAKPLEPTGSGATFSLVQQHEDSDTDNDAQNNDIASNRSNLEGNIRSIDLEGDRLMACDDDTSYRSYSSNGSEVSFADDENVVFDSGERSVISRASLASIVMLQFIVVVVVFKEPITNLTSTVTWNSLLFTMCLAFIAAIADLSYNSSWHFSHRAGLFLILRNAIPSDAMVVSSFTYSILESQPMMLQSLSVVSLVVRMASSWSYEKLWARFSNGRALTAAIGFLAILAGMASLLNIAVYRKYEDLVSTTNNEIIKDLWGLIILANMATTFFSEWAFLPEVVLASVSVNENEKGESHQASERRRRAEPDTAESQPNARQTSDVMVAVEYGSLIACIEFGDQLGSLVAAPIVSSLGISRENNFNRMDEFLLICSLSTIIGTIAILPLTRKR